MFHLLKEPQLDLHTSLLAHGLDTNVTIFLGLLSLLN